jgi:hypothetical protein
VAVNANAGYSSYRPQGDTLSFTLSFNDYTSDSLFSHALQVRQCLSEVVRPCGFNLWLRCVIEDAWITVREPKPSQPYWQIREQDSPAPVIHHTPAGLPFVTRVLPRLTDDGLTEVFHEAVDTSSCGDGFLATFGQLAPTAILARVVDQNLVGPHGSLSIQVDDEALTLTTSNFDGGFWLAVPPGGPIYLPPVDFTVAFDSILTTNISVNWSRWLDRGTGEHRALETALRSMMKLGWQLDNQSYSFDL